MKNLLISCQAEVHCRRHHGVDFTNKYFEENYSKLRFVDPNVIKKLTIAVVSMEVIFEKCTNK